MKCPKKNCAGKMRVTRSYTDGGKVFQSRECDKCSKRGNYITQAAADQASTPRALMLKERSKPCR